MKIYILILLIVIIILYVNKFFNKKEDKDINRPILEEEETTQTKGRTVDYPESTSISQVLNKIKEIIPLPILNFFSPEPINIIRNNGNYKPIIYNPIELDNQIISANPEKSTEYRFIDENPKKAWSDKNVSQFPKYHNSMELGELTKTGEFFDENKQYNDNTSPQSTKHLPDRCFMNGNNDVVCKFNDKLQNIPPSLIDGNNELINSIGNEDIYTNSIEGNIIKGLDESKEKTINGGEYLEGVKGYYDKDNYFTLDNIPTNIKYSI